VTKISTSFAEFELDWEGSRLSQQPQARQNEGQKQAQVALHETLKKRILMQFCGKVGISNMRYSLS